MAIRLGTQNWINPAPFAAAAELTVEAGRAEGQMYANIGQGINRAVSGYEQKKERDRTRQDALTQQGVMNARADRAEAEMLKRGKLAASESILAAKRMNYEMAAKMHESFGTPETEAAVLKAQQDFQEANNWYQVSVGNNAQIETPSSSVPDYVGGSGMVVDGKTTSQMTDAELDDFLAKSERGEVDITYRGGATGDMGQGVGNVPPAARPAAGPSAEAAMEMAAETTDEAVLGKAQADYTKALANSRRYPGHAKAQNELADAERRLTTLKLEYTKKQQEAEDNRKQATDTANANAALRRLPNPETGRPYLSMAEPDLPLKAAEILLNNAKVAGGSEARLPAQMAAIDRRGEIADNRLDKTQGFKRETIAKMETRAKWLAEFRKQAAIELEGIRSANKAPAEQARATRAAAQSQKNRMVAAKDRYDTLRKQYDDGKEVGAEFYGDANTPSAWDLYEAEREKYFALTEAAQSAAPAAAPAGGGDPMAQAEAEYNALPDDEKTPEAAARIAAKYGVK